MFCGKIRCRYIPSVKPTLSVKTVKTVKTVDAVETVQPVEIVETVQPDKSDKNINFEIVTNCLTLEEIERFIYHYTTKNSIME